MNKLLYRLQHGWAVWLLVLIFLAAFLASFSELQRTRSRFGEVTGRQFYDPKDKRYFAIRKMISGLAEPIVILGDSITERASFPESIDGHALVNAGISGGTTLDFIAIAPALLRDVKPAMIVIALGTNDIGSQTERQDYAALLIALKKVCPNLLALAAPQRDGSILINAQIKAAAQSEGVRFIEIPLPDGSKLADNVHLNDAGYRTWTPAVIAAIDAP